MPVKERSTSLWLSAAKVRPSSVICAHTPATREPSCTPVRMRISSPRLGATFCLPELRRTAFVYWQALQTLDALSLIRISITKQPEVLGEKAGSATLQAQSQTHSLESLLNNVAAEPNCSARLRGLGPWRRRTRGCKEWEPRARAGRTKSLGP